MCDCSLHFVVKGSQGSKRFGNLAIITQHLLMVVQFMPFAAKIAFLTSLLFLQYELILPKEKKMM